MSFYCLIFDAVEVWFGEQPVGAQRAALLQLPNQHLQQQQHNRIQQESFKSNTGFLSANPLLLLLRSKSVLTVGSQSAYRTSKEVLSAYRTSKKVLKRLSHL